ncbi:hypothetical protein C8Q80DRAFT_1274929 [Daedaleopsis nitida]|nr:hypothetical protein C8Q80DRAFT_1274929 [Daedaleopsis nitida]
MSLPSSTATSPRLNATLRLTSSPIHRDISIGNILMIPHYLKKDDFQTVMCLGMLCDWELAKNLNLSNARQSERTPRPAPESSSSATMRWFSPTVVGNKLYPLNELFADLMTRLRARYDILRRKKAKAAQNNTPYFKLAKSLETHEAVINVFRKVLSKKDVWPGLGEDMVGYDRLHGKRALARIRAIPANRRSSREWCLSTTPSPAPLTRVRTEVRLLVVAVVGRLMLSRGRFLEKGPAHAMLRCTLHIVNPYVSPLQVLDLDSGCFTS